jgi:hypothetical protein
MKNIQLLTVSLITVTFMTAIGCDFLAEKCDEPVNVACPDNCDKVVRLASPLKWEHTAGADFFTITVTFDKEVDADASGMSGRNGLVVYQRPDTDPNTVGGMDIAGTITPSTGTSKTFVFTSSNIGNAFIIDPANYFEIAVENNVDGIRTTDQGVFDADNTCTNGATELREFKQFN